jgi:hypothetical protein
MPVLLLYYPVRIAAETGSFFDNMRRKKRKEISSTLR